MLRCILLVVGVLVTLVKGGTTEKRCTGLRPDTPDSWCANNCNHNPPYCPPTHCKCSGPYQIVEPPQHCGIGREITTEADCREAAQTLGWDFGQAINSASFRRNCWANINNKTYFNTNNKLKKGGKTWAICASSTGGTTEKRCTGLRPDIPDSWCTNNCNHNPPYCPPTHCKC